MELADALMTRLWDEFRDAAIAEDARPDFVRHMKLAFFAGADGSMDAVGKASINLDMREAVLFLSAMRRSNIRVIHGLIEEQEAENERQAKPVVQ